MSSHATADVSRRDFIKGTALAIGSCVGAIVGLPGLAYLFSPSLRRGEGDAWIDLGPLNDYPPGQPTSFDFTRTVLNGWERTATPYGVFVVRQEGDTARVFSNVCTHLGCHVNWHPDLRHYVSPCHDGHFDVLGRNISGPPPRPLDEFRTRVDDGRLLIQLPPFRRTS